MNNRPSGVPDGRSTTQNVYITTTTGEMQCISRWAYLMKPFGHCQRKSAHAASPGRPQEHSMRNKHKAASNSVESRSCITAAITRTVMTTAGCLFLFSATPAAEPLPAPGGPTLPRMIASILASAQSTPQTPSSPKHPSHAQANATPPPPPHPGQTTVDRSALHTKSPNRHSSIKTSQREKDTYTANTLPQHALQPSQHTETGKKKPTQTR